MRTDDLGSRRLRDRNRTQNGVRPLPFAAGRHCDQASMLRPLLRLHRVPLGAGRSPTDHMAARPMARKGGALRVLRS